MNDGIKRAVRFIPGHIADFEINRIGIVGCRQCPGLAGIVGFPGAAIQAQSRVCGIHLNAVSGGACKCGAETGGVGIIIVNDKAVHCRNHCVFGKDFRDRRGRRAAGTRVIQSERQIPLG